MEKSFINELHCAITSSDPSAFYNYWNTCSVGQLRRDIEELTSTPEKDMKDFTKAAMQGLLSASWYTDESMHGQLAKAAVSAARATLNELQKQQP